MFHHAFVPGSRINPFHHARIRMAQKIRNLRGGLSAFLKLRAKCRAKVVIRESHDLKVFQRFFADLCSNRISAILSGRALKPAQSGKSIKNAEADRRRLLRLRYGFFTPLSMLFRQPE